MGNQQGEAPDHPAEGPDYDDLSNMAIAYRWVPREQGREPGSQPVILGELAAALELRATEQGARLVGQMAADFPEYRALPKEVRRALLRTLQRQEPRWWRRGSLVLVRAWQHTEPATDSAPAPKG
ncbi:hypothetical protein [Streptomyces venezuelae]|uniref:hypothetical protein n=1 Tax=Streptomyces venezuelae TaxID=54571 RepID=UPI003438DC31